MTKPRRDPPYDLQIPEPDVDGYIRTPKGRPYPKHLPKPARYQLRQYDKLVDREDAERFYRSVPVRPYGPHNPKPNFWADLFGVLSNDTFLADKLNQQNADRTCLCCYCPLPTGHPCLPRSDDPLADLPY